MAHITLGTLFLAKADTWGHQDGTATIRVHAAITAPDEDGNFWALRGSSQYHSPKTSKKVAPSQTSHLLKTTWFSVLEDATVHMNVRDIRRITGTLTAQEFNSTWDLIEAQA